MDYYKGNLNESCEICRYWSERLKILVQSSVIIGQSSTCKVYRVYTTTGSYVIKESSNADAVRREVSVHQSLDNLPWLSGMVPKVVRWMEIGDGTAYIVFSDNQLESVQWAPQSLEPVMMSLMRLHQTDISEMQSSGADMCSHTPNWQAVRDKVIACNPTRLMELLAEYAGVVHFDGRTLGVAQCTERLRELIHQTMGFFAKDVDLQNRLFNSSVLCHGDAHMANIMWSRSENRIYLIDWEYLHVDTPYFDLFQMLDATSPMTQLERPVTRLDALHAYHKLNGFEMTINQAKRIDDSLKEWLQGYLWFASLHLFWIVLRIEQDIRTQKFDTCSLKRQLNETCDGLLSIHRDFRHIES